MDNAEKIKKYKFFQELKKLPFVKSIILYGSRAKNINMSRSDIDLGINLDVRKNHPISNTDWFEIMDIIDKADTLLKIDCININELSIDNPLRESILKNGIVLYEKSQE